METPRTGLSSPAGEATGSFLPTVSIVIPAYNEAHRIGPSLDRVLAYLEDRCPASEVLVVDDGSEDGTAEIVSAYGAPVRVVSNPANCGKGFSVQRGLKEASGCRVLFTDADLSAPIEELDRLMEAADAGADIAIGSRAIDRSKILIHQSRSREWGGIVFNWAVRLILGLRIQDTQCGFKLFDRQKTLPVFARQTISGFGFDPEILFLAEKSGLSVREVPVRWRHDSSTKVRFLRDGIGMALDLLRIRWRWWTGRYDSSGTTSR